ncbi:MAG: hypothetical protein ACTSXF_00715 [Promethearchaeota archaeon]
MKHFEEIREQKSAFYKDLWAELSNIKVIDTHEHFDTNEKWYDVIKMEERLKIIDKGDNLIRLPYFFARSYVELSKRGDFDLWAKELKAYMGTGYLTSWMIAMEDLYDLEGPITPDYLREMERLLNEAYSKDLERNTYNHLEEVLKKEMNVEYAILNIDLGDHSKLPQPICRGAAGIPSILNGIKVPSDDEKNQNLIRQNVVYKFAKDTLKMNLKDIQTLDDYCEVTEKLLKYLRDSGDYCCIKMQMAYERSLFFPEPGTEIDNDNRFESMDEDKYEEEIAAKFNKYPEKRSDLISFGNYMMHRVLEWTSLNWRVPYQLHTGLARMYYGDSNAINLSYLFEKYPDMHFDLFHGNYPYNNLPGMLHQIKNISADLCWLPAVSPSAARSTLLQLLEVGDMVADISYHTPSMRTNLFGGDSGIVEGSYGALQLAKDVLINVLEELYNRGTLYSKSEAIELAKRVLFENPKRIFNL